MKLTTKNLLVALKALEYAYRRDAPCPPRKKNSCSEMQDAWKLIDTACKEKLFDPLADIHFEV
jgi:hypothetical protein